MNSNPEQQLQQFRLPEPSPELRTRILAAARKEWNRPVSVSAWWTLRRPLLAVAAALVLVFAASWTNRHLTSPGAVAAVLPPGEPVTPELESIGLPSDLARCVFVIPPNPVSLAAVLQAQRTQILELEMLLLPQPPAPGGQTSWFRQNPAAPASCG